MNRPAVAPLAEGMHEAFGHRLVSGRHTLAGAPLFDDAQLADLLDHYPRQRLHALSMGFDPARSDENRLALHAGVTGLELLRAVRRGRLWLNLTRVDEVDRRYRELIDRLYGELSAQLPGFAPDRSQGTLLISSPRALVYYHVDGPASVLWQLRGSKRVWVYPAGDERFVARSALEDIFAGTRHEYLPYDTAFDAAAQVTDLAPGQWLHWPHNAPHRVTNLDSVNVSLSTEHFTPQGRRRARVQIANRFFRLHGLPGLSAREDGAGALAKVLVHQVATRLGLDRRPPKQHAPTLRVDPEAPGGVAPLAGAPGVPA